MSDADLKLLEKRVREAPTDTAARDRLERAWIRIGRGWHGEECPSSVGATVERGVYLAGGKGLDPGIEMVYVPGGETECFACENGGLDSGGVTPWGASIELPCEVCRGTGRGNVAPFYVGRYPVTWREYVAFNPGCIVPGSSGPSGRGWESSSDLLRPATFVTEQEAAGFAAWAGLRLLTLAEWMWAALGDTRLKVCPGCGGKCSSWVGDNNTGFDSDCSWCGATGKRRDRHHPWDELNRPTKPPTAARCVWAGHPEFGAHVMHANPPFSPRPSTIGPGITAPVAVWEDADGKRISDVHLPHRPRLARLVPARPDGKSWCGAHDMAGNVWERCTGGVVLGGSFRREPMSEVGPYLPDLAADDIGFRVALSAS